MGEADAYCARCGRDADATASGETEEKTLYSVGPMWVTICYSRPSMFALTFRNMTRIVLTDRRVYGFPKGSLVPTEMIPFKSKARFQVPYETIVATERVNFGLQKGIYIQYREEDRLKEVSILCSPINSHQVSRIYELLQGRVGAR
jgi:hypothetical protein